MHATPSEPPLRSGQSNQFVLLSPMSSTLGTTDADDAGGSSPDAREQRGEARRGGPAVADPSKDTVGRSGLFPRGLNSGWDMEVRQSAPVVIVAAVLGFVGRPAGLM
jgi:hypothetical protein